MPAARLLLMRASPPSPPAPPALTAEEEAELVMRAGRGVEAAQGALFRRHAPRLLPLLQRLLASQSDAEDALQDTFLQAFQDLPRLRDPGAFGPWLRQVAVHQAHRRFRRRRLLALIGLDGPPPDATLARLADRGASAEARAELGRIDAALARLPAPERSAWVLRHVEGYELEEVARLCRCSLATAKRRIAAAQARVARELGYNEESEDRR